MAALPAVRPATREHAASDWVRRRVNGLTRDTLLTLARIYRDGGQELAERLRRLIDQYGGEALWPLAAPLLVQQRAVRLQSLLVQADGLIQRLIVAAQDEVLASTLRSYRMGYHGAAWTLDTELPAGLLARAPLLPDEAVRAAALYPYEGLDLFQRFTGQRAAFVDRVRRSTALSQLSGDSVSQATSRLLRELGVPVGGGTPVRTRRLAAAQALQVPVRSRGLTPRQHAELIARTELQRASFNGAMAVYGRNRDVLDGWEWLTAPGACPVCAPLDGKVYRLDDPDAPTIPRHPRCRCSAAPAAKSFADLGVFGLDEYEPKPRRSYRRWADDRGLPEWEDGGLREQRPLRLERE